MDITIVTPAYNAEKYIAECIESVRCQDGVQVEHIIIDDGSADLTREIVSGYPGVTYLRQENRGANTARNVGISLAKGKYIKLLDADDFLIGGSLLKQFRLSEERHEGVIGYGYHIAFLEAEGREEIRSPAHSRFDRLERLIMTNILTSLSLYPSSALRAVSGFNENLHARQEWDLNLRLLAAGYTFIHDNVLTYKQRYHDLPGRISNRKLDFSKELDALEKVYESLPSPKSRSVNDAWAAYLWGVGRQFIYQKQVGAAKELFLRARQYSSNGFYEHLGLKYKLARIFLGDTLPDRLSCYIRDRLAARKNSC